MARGTITVGRFAEAIASVMDAEGVSAETLAMKPPERFWVKVGSVTGQTGDTARAYWRLHKDELIALLSGSGDTGANHATATSEEQEAESNLSIVAIPESEAIATPATTASADTVTREELHSALEQMEARLTTLLEQKVNDAMNATVAITAKVAGTEALEDPPKPGKIGLKNKKFAGELAHVRGLVDANLAKLLEKDCETSYGGNMSRTLNAVLWRYYGRPRLSFESGEDPANQEP